MTNRLRSWSERLHDVRGRTDILAPLGECRQAAVAMPGAGIRTTPENLALLLEHLAAGEPEPYEPTDEELDGWMRNGEVDE